MDSQLASFDAEEVFQIVIAGLKRSPQFNCMPQYPETPNSAKTCFAAPEYQ